MNLPLFIARRLAFSEKNNISSTIIKIAIGAVSVSVAAMIIAVFMIKGFQDGISNKMFGFWGHIDILSYESSDHITSFPIRDYEKYRNDISEIEKINYLDYEDGLEHKTQGGVNSIHKYILYPSILKTKESYEGIVLKGIGSDYNPEYLERYIEKGDMLSLDSDSIINEIIISQYTSNRLKLDVGDKVIANFISENDQKRKALRVKGIYSLGISEYERKLSFVNIKLLQNVLNWRDDEIGGLEVYIENIEDLEAINEYIHVELLPADIRSATIKDKFRGIFGWLDILNVNKRVILILMTLVSIINMITALLILILEKTNMIGILKSLGATNWNIRKIFLYSGAYIVAFGLLIGNALGVGISLIQKYFGVIKLDEASYYFSEAPVYFDIWSLLLINVGTMVITVIFLVVPSYLVSVIDPVKAIRFK